MLTGQSKIRLMCEGLCLRSQGFPVTPVLLPLDASGSFKSSSIGFLVMKRAHSISFKLKIIGF